MNAAGADLPYGFKRILPVNEQIQYNFKKYFKFVWSLLELSFVIIRHFFPVKNWYGYGRTGRTFGAGPVIIFTHG